MFVCFCLNVLLLCSGGLQLRGTRESVSQPGQVGSTPLPDVHGDHARRKVLVDWRDTGTNLPGEPSYQYMGIVFTYQYRRRLSHMDITHGYRIRISYMGIIGGYS